MDYANVEGLRGYLPQVSSEEDEAALAEMLTRGSRAIDDYTRRPADAFKPAAEEASEQVFYGADSAVLLLTEFVAGTISGVTAPGDYLPPGYVEFRRHRVVGLHTATSQKILTPHVHWTKNVPFTVTARWGYAATPGAIKEALMQLVVRWWRTKDEGFGGIVGQFGADRTVYEKGFPSGVKTLLEPYVLEAAVEDESAGEIERGSLRDSDTNADGGGWSRW